jgi:ketosteroid isomerase-like protein
MASENLELVRSIYGDWERGDFSRVDWASPDVELTLADGPDPQTWKGLTAMAEGWRSFERAWESLRVELIALRELDAEHVLSTVRFVGRTRGSELELEQVPTLQGCVLQLRGGRVTKLVLYWHLEQALADLGLAE